MSEGGGHPPTPDFPGAGRFFRLIGALFLRPRYGDRPRELVEHGRNLRWDATYPRSGRSERQGLPMVCLMQPDESTSVIDAVDSLLGSARPKQASPPRARVQNLDECRWEGARSGAWSAADVEAVSHLLRDARNLLVTSSDNRDRRLRFPLFSLVCLLMDSNPDANEPNPGRWRIGLFQQQGVMRRIETAVQTIDKDVVAGRIEWRIPLWLMYVLTLGIYRLSLTGRIPLLSGRYRWFMRQPHLAPELSGTFVRFAGRLGAWRSEDPEYVARLLVNAFLEDLRRGYRLPWWSVSGTRRMTYPVLLLDDAAMSAGGDRLLWLVNEIRNQTGLFDPLLIVAAGPTVRPNPGRREGDRIESHPASQAAIAYAEWQRRLSESRRARRAVTWYLLLEITRPDTTAQTPAVSGLEGFKNFDLESIKERRAVRPPLWTYGPVRVAVVVVVVAALALIPIRYSRNHCWTLTSMLDRHGSECVGVSAGSYDLFQPSDETSAQVVHVIHAQNDEAERKHKLFPARPYITIAEVEATTSSDGTVDGLTAERESLEGVATAQRRQLDQSGDADPIVRVLLVNAGQGMQQAEVVAHRLGRLADADRSLVGVIGLDMSSTPTLRMVQALSAAGLPMVASTLSVESLTSGHPMYFQVAPTNTTEAQVVAKFAANRAQHDDSLPKTVRIYYSDDPADTYSADLRDSAQTAFGAKGFQVQTLPFIPGRANASGRDTCGYNGFVFFAGRGVPDYGDFLGGAAQCSSKAVFIGDDDVSRYVADAPKRQGNRALDFYYASFAFAPPIKERYGAELDFYQELEQLFPFENDPAQGRSLDGHAALAYDAAQVMITAASYLHTGTEDLPITAGTVWREITDIHSSGNAHREIDGVSGIIDYGGDITRQVPVDKPVDIMQVVHGDVNPDIVGFCGNNGAHHTESGWCHD